MWIVMANTRRRWLGTACVYIYIYVCIYIYIHTYTYMCVCVCEGWLRSDDLTSNLRYLCLFRVFFYCVYFIQHGLFEKSRRNKLHYPPLNYYLFNIYIYYKFKGFKTKKNCQKTFLFRTSIHHERSIFLHLNHIKASVQSEYWDCGAQALLKLWCGLHLSKTG
jgi:hypothetical protein